MSDESRKDPRARIAGIRVKYERAGSEASHDHVKNLGRGGIFIATQRPLVVGKLVHVELSVPGDADTLSATGRVVWIRGITVNDDRPAGMGVKFIDVDEGALEVISRMVREHDSPKPGATAPAREKTIMGVGHSEPPPRLEPPPAVHDENAPSNVVVAPEPEPPPPAPEATPKREPKPEPKPEPKAAPVAAVKEPEKGSGGGVWLLVVIVAVVVAAFVYWDRILGLLRR